MNNIYIISNRSHEMLQVLSSELAKSNTKKKKINIRKQLNMNMFVPEFRSTEINCKIINVSTDADKSINIGGERTKPNPFCEMTCL